MRLSSRRYEVESLEAVQEFFHHRGWTDGLPIVPPTVEIVQACLDKSSFPADYLVGIEPVRGRHISAEKLAVNSIMAGCLPSYFPSVVAAITAILQKPFLLHGAMASTSGCAVLMVFNGPIRKELGMSSTFSVLGGSGNRATTAIGRAVYLTLFNLLDFRPGMHDQSTIGHPSKFSYCLAEDEENTLWESLAVERGVPKETSAVTVMAAMAPRQIMNEWTTVPEEILDTFIAEMKANMRHYSIYAGNYIIIIPPQLRAHFLNAAWSKQDIQHYVFEKARVRRSEWADCGKSAIVGSKPETEFKALVDPNHLLIIAAGGPAGGFGAVIPPQRGEKSKAVTVDIDAALDCG